MPCAASLQPVFAGVFIFGCFAAFIFKMNVIKKYYDKHGRLRVLKGKVKKESVIRLKVIKGNEWPCCDWHGTCTNKAYAEVYPVMIKKNKGWSYLCRKHYYQEEKRYKWKLPACLKVEW